MADKLRQLVRDFAFGRMDVLAHREKLRIEAEETAALPVRT
jgi:hypothetical protein